MIIFTVSLFQLVSASIIVVLASLAVYLGTKVKHAEHVAQHAEHVAQHAERVAQHAEQRAFVASTLLTLTSGDSVESIDFLRLLDAVDVLVGDTIIDLDEIHAKINPQTGTAKTDDYASLGDQDDVSMDDWRTGSTGRSQAGVGDTNDFSCFRCHMSTPSAFLVKRWLPHDEALHQVVCAALFGSSASALDAFLDNAAAVRRRCLKLLCYAGQPNENCVRCVCIMFLRTILRPMEKWTVLPTAGRRLLSATIPTKRRHSDDSSVAYEPATWTGFAGVGIVGRGARERSKPPPLVVGEIKPWLRGARAYQPKDQLLIEMEAMRAALQTNKKNQKKHPFVRGFLTDLFAINVAIADARDNQAVVFHVAPRVCAHRSYLLRLLFLLCEGVSTSQWDLLLLSLEPPVAKPASNVRTRSQAREEAAAPTGHVGRRSSHRTGEETPATTDTQSSPEREAAVINFKEDDELEEQEEHYRSLLLLALRWQGINYLCEATLEQASAEYAQKAINADGAFSDALDPRRRASWTAYR